MLFSAACLLPLTLPLSLSEVSAAQSFSLAQTVIEQLDVNHFSIVELELPQGGSIAPVSLRVPIELGGRLRHLDLRAHSVRSPGFALQIQDSFGRLVRVPAPPPVTYRGTVLGRSDSRVALSLHPGGIKAIVREGDGRVWYVQPLGDVQASAGGKEHLVYEQSSFALPEGFCGAESLAPQKAESKPPREAGSACLKVAELAFDCDYETFLANGSDVGATLADIDAVVNAANVYYARDVLIEHQLSAVIVRSSEPDPYTSFDPNGALNELVNEWRTNQAGVVRDTVHLATGKELNGNVIGLAFVGVVCNLPWAFGLTQWNLSFGGRVLVLAHELGHNWNAPHCLDPCDIMCGGCPFFGPLTTEVILAYRDGVECLEDGPPYGSPLPPHVRGEALDIDGPVVIDVLANDLDGNCDTLTIDAFDAVGQEGGLVTRSVGTGPDGRDELAYTPPDEFQGVDRFAYEVGDGTGHLVEGSVILSSYDQEPDIAAHYPFDELSGTVMLDASGNELHGSYIDGPGLGQPGAAEGTGTSVNFAGLLDRGRIDDGSPLSGLRGELSIAVWLRPSATVGLRPIFGNPQSWTFAIRDGDLTFIVEDGAEHSLPASLPLNEWSHVAAVFDDRQDVHLYLNGQPLGTLLGNATLNEPGERRFVAGSGVSGPFYRGHLDDLQVYDSMLSDMEVQVLFEYPGTVIERCEPTEVYCQSGSNSVGPGAEILSEGSTHLFRNDFALLAFGLPTGKAGLFYYGPNRIEVPFGNGFRCVGGAVHRFPIQLSDGFGTAHQPVDYDNPPDAGGRIEAGSSWNFQFWYRDPAGGGAAFNLTNAVAAEFCP